MAGTSAGAKKGWASRKRAGGKKAEYKTVTKTRTNQDGRKMTYKLSVNKRDKSKSYKGLVDKWRKE